MTASGAEVRQFTELKVWRKSHELFLDVMNELQDLPRTRVESVLSEQVLASLGAVGANIARGFHRGDGKYLSCLDIALGEASASESWLYKLGDSNMIEADRANEYVRQSVEVQKMLSGLIRSVSDSMRDR